MTAPRLQLADELLRRFAASLRSGQLYSKGHPIIARNLEALSRRIAAAARPRSRRSSSAWSATKSSSTTCRWPRPTRSARSIRRLQQSGVERITIDRGVTLEEIATFVDAVTTLDARDAPRTTPPRVPGDAAHPRRPRHRRAARRGQPRPTWPRSSGCTARRSRWPATSGTARRPKGSRTPTAARTMIDGLAQAVAQNRTALLALTTLKNYDNYTFTHMVNVSILTMGQARGLGIDGPLLREFGLAALMHDIGKVQDAARDPEQAGQADRRGVRDHEAPRRRRRRDPARRRRTSRRSRRSSPSSTTCGSTAPATRTA